MEFSIFLLVSTLLLAWVGRVVVRVVYNVFIHPLRKFPGPWAAGATEWWKTWSDVVKQESFTDVLLRLHKQYGMFPKISPSALTEFVTGDVVRVGPNEVSSAILVEICTYDYSFILQTLRRTMRSIAPQHAGTKTGYCMRHLGKIILPSVSSPILSRSSEKMYCNRCSRDEQSSACNLSYEKP